MWGVRWRGLGGAEKSLLMMLVAHGEKMKSLPALRNKLMCSSEVTSRSSSGQIQQGKQKTSSSRYT
jgi:hypothetical protein